MTKHELEWCISEYGRDIYSFCKYLTGNISETDDLYQDTFLTAVELLQKIDCEHNPKSYLLSVALRIWKNKKRKFAWRNRIAEIHSLAEERETDKRVSEALTPEEEFICKEKEELVRQAVAGLSDRLKPVVLLFYMEDLQVSTIANVLKLPEGTVLSRLHQARKVLRKKLEDVFDGKGI